MTDFDIPTIEQLMGSPSFVEKLKYDEEHYGDLFDKFLRDWLKYLGEKNYDK